MPVAFTVDRAAATAAAKTIARRQVTDVTRRVLNRAIVLTPVDTGNLRAQNRSRIRETRTTVTGEVFNNTAYAPPVHDGARAVTIRPKRRKALRFVVGGQVVFAKSVQIPARRGRPWLYRAMLEVAQPLGWKVTRF